jgi:spore coat protein U-like protein
VRTSSIVLYLITAALVPQAFAASASSPSNPDNITATVAPACSVTTFAVNFGTYDATAATAKLPEGTPTFNVRCTVGTTYEVSVGNGESFATSRRMRLGATSSYLEYNLDATPPTGGGAGTGQNQSYTVTGDIPVSQFVTPGAYSDTVVVTVTY